MVVIVLTLILCNSNPKSNIRPQQDKFILQTPFVYISPVSIKFMVCIPVRYFGSVSVVSCLHVILCVLLSGASYFLIGHKYMLTFGFNTVVLTKCYFQIPISRLFKKLKYSLAYKNGINKNPCKHLIMWHINFRPELN